MPTNNFGDNWLTEEERNFWGVDEHGNPVPFKVKTDRELDDEVRRTNFQFATVMMIAGGIVLFWAWVAIALVAKAFGYNIIN